jgi:hypothetical protein
MSLPSGLHCKRICLSVSRIGEFKQGTDNIDIGSIQIFEIGIVSSLPFHSEETRTQAFIVRSPPVRSIAAIHLMD